MATWIDFTRTNQGLALDAKLTGGTTPLRITKAMSASGKVSYMKLKEQTELTNPVQTLSILEKQYGEDNTSFVLPIKLLNTGLTTKYNMYQLGIFAEDPDLGEILYMICQTSTESGEEIPTEAEQPGFSIQWNHKIQFADATNVEVSVTEVGTLTQEEAAVTYLRIDDATSKYLSKTDAAATYATAEEVSVMGESLAADYATKEYVDVNGGKIDTISVNGTKQAIDADKNVELTMPTKVSELENDEEYGKAADLATHTADSENPHAVTKTQVGLGNVDNTPDVDKPVSKAQDMAIADAKKSGTDAQTNLTVHTGNTTAHITEAERTAWNAKADKTYTDSQDAAKLEESKEYARSLISALVDGAPETADTLKELANAIGSNKDLIDVLNAAIGTKVDKETGKGLSTNDYTTDEKQKLAIALTQHQDITGKADKTYVDSQDTVLNTAIGLKADKSDTLAGYGITDAYTKNEIENMSVELADGFLPSKEQAVLKGALTVEDSETAMDTGGYVILSALNVRRDTVFSGINLLNNSGELCAKICINNGDDTIIIGGSTNPVQKIDFTGKILKNVSNPTESQDVATKSYVDSLTMVDTTTEV